MNSVRRIDSVVVCGLTIAVLTGCGGSSSTTTQVVAAVVNDLCSSHESAGDCRADTEKGCSWIALGQSCPDGATCPSGICITPDPCGSIHDSASCNADDRCAWSQPLAASSMPILCPAGQDCMGGGYCHGRDLSGAGCACV